jgi:hypothetical protein
MKPKKDIKKWKEFMEGKHTPKREERIRLSKVDLDRIEFKKKKKAEYNAKYYWKHKNLDAD